MLAALTDQKSGHSTPRCSKFTDPSRQFVMTTSRRSQVTSSYGWTPARVWIRRMVSPLRAPLPPCRDDPLAVSVMSSPFRDPVDPSRARPGPVPFGLLLVPGALPGTGPLFLLRRGALRPGGEQICPGRARPCPIGRELTVLVIATPSLLAPGPQRGDFFLEVGERLEPPVDGGKPQVRHLVKLAERAENSQAHLV